MPKRRAEQLASEQQAGEHEALERTVATAGGGAGSPPLKRPRGAPLNFSIESIMQPAGVAQHQHQQQHLQSLNLNLNYHHAQHLHQLSQLNQLSHQLSPRSSSPASSLASSRSGASELSSCASPIEISSSGSQQRQRRRHHQDHQRRRRPKRERGEEARLELGGGGGGADSPNATISRASTPISPGGVGELPGDQSDSGSGGALRQQAALAAAFGRSFAANMKADYRGPAADLKGAPASYQNPLQQQQHEQQRASIIKSEQHSTSSLSSASSASSATSGAPPTRSAHKSRPPNHSEPAASTSAQQASGGAAAAAANPHLSLSSSARLNQVECVLDNKEMWDKFHSLNTEMIITKTGRRMFPVLKVQFYNLDPSARYAVSMDIVPVDNKRYRYAYHKSCWQVAGKADPSAEPRLYPHPDSPFNGDLLARQVISFEKVKLTNNEMDKSGHIILNSMHKYQPRVHLIELKSTMPPVGVASSCGGGGGGVNGATKLGPLAGSGANTTGSRYAHQQAAAAFQQQQQQQKPTPQLDIEGYRTYVFPETVFTAVTAYQNQLITKMKIDKNPFAKGFRDSSRLSDLDRSDPFDYMSSLGPAAACAAAAAAAAHAHRGMGMGVGVGPGGFAPGAAAASQAAMLMMSSSPHHHHHHLQQQQQLLDGQPGGMPPGPPQPPGNANNPNNPNHLDQAYAQLIAAAQNPWYAAAAAAAAASGAPASNPFGPLTTAPAPPPPPAMPATPTSAACGAAAAGNSAQQQQQQQQQQLQATQMWLAAFSACLSGNAAPPGGPPSPGALGSMLASPASNRPTPTRGHEDARSPPI